jgi:hypothetical protein
MRVSFEVRQESGEVIFQLFYFTVTNFQTISECILKKQGIKECIQLNGNLPVERHGHMEG